MLALALVLVFSAAAAIAAGPAKAMYCDVSYRSCASDDPPDDGGMGGGGVTFNFNVGDKVGSKPSEMQLRGWECTDWIGSCGDDATFTVTFKKCDSTYRYIARCEKNLIGSFWSGCYVREKQQYLFWC